MNKLGKIVLSLIIVISLSLPFIANFKYSDALSDFSNEKYISDLTSIYKEYDGNLENKSKTDPLALNRIIIADYNGKAYGCAKRAWDRKSKFAILQYDSRQEAADALAKAKADGCIADGDSLAKLIGDEVTPELGSVEKGMRKASTKGNFNPTGSNYLGTTQFINKLNMVTDDIIVGVVDTGVMYDHTSIADRFYSYGHDLSSDGYVDAYYDTSLTGEYFGHATMVSGIIADNTPDNVKIQPYKAVAFGATYATASAMMSGINMAVNEGASVVSMSLSASSSKELFATVIDNAKSRGVVVCSSAGNNGEQISMSPANVEDNVTVSALDGDTIADFSNYGSTVDFTAQGKRIRSTYPLNGKSGFARGSGTSFSTPYIAACCADIKSLNKDMSWDDVYQTLLDFVVDLGEEGCDDYYGHGAPYLGNMVYTDNSSYTFNIPEGTLSVTAMNDYTKDTQPWRRFAKNMIEVTVDDSIDRIGSYAFYNMRNAEFTMRDTYDNIGAYAFYACSNVTSFTFGIDVESVGYGAFLDIDGFVMSGYRNTPAEMCAIHDNLTFNVLGCKHNYYYEVIDPTKTEPGYTLYTCSVCGDQYTGEYIPPNVVKTGMCGVDMTYTLYDTGKLTLSGSGDMYNYLYSAAPWSSYKNSITKVVLDDDVNEISPFAFYGCTNIKKFTVSEDNPYYYQNTSNLIMKDGNTLVLAVAYGNYEMPDIVENFNSTAFIFNMPNSVIPNDNFTYANDIIYDSDGNIVMALTSYSDSEFTFIKNAVIRKYAFLFTELPDTVYCDWINASVEDYGIGYTYDGTLQKREMTFYTASGSLVYDYATRKGFTVITEDRGKCGDDMSWRYDINNSKLILTGTGDMYTYASKSDIPWSSYISTMKRVVIGDSVGSVSQYSFNRAAKLVDLTLPLSLKAPENEKTWQGCTSIITIKFTLGTGYSDDYYRDNNNLIYSYTPWYYSRSSINSFTLDKNVKYIGKCMFRNCSAIKSLTFNCVEEIADHAFQTCTNFKSVTNYCKTTVYHDCSLFSYATNSIYENRNLYAYCDSTSKDFCQGNVINFVSIGCGHSRSTHFVRAGQTGCFSTGVVYYCDDCESEFNYESTPIGEEHGFEFTAFNLDDEIVQGAEVYINNYLFGVTNKNGKVTGTAVSGTYPVSIVVNSCEMFSGEITIPDYYSFAEVHFRYGNYNGDNAVNGKDYAISMRNEYNDKALYNYGKVTEGENTVRVR